MPFITEALWQALPHKGESIMIAPWPLLEGQTNAIDEKSISTFQDIQALVRAVRNARAEYKVEAGKKIGAQICSSRPEILASMIPEKDIIALLARVEGTTLTFSDDASALSKDKSFVRLIVTESLDVFLPMADMVDKEKELLRLGKQAEKLKKDINGLEIRLQSPGFTEKAPKNLIEEVTGLLNDKRIQLSSVEESMLTLR